MIRQPSKTEGFFYPFGFSFLGPVYATFVSGVIEILKKYNIKTVYFIAREGELFLQIFQRLAPHFLNEKKLPLTKYVYLTRKSTALASLYRGFSFEKAIIPLYNPKQQGLYSLCNVYGLPPHELIQKAREYGFKDIKSPIYNYEDKQFKRFISDRGVQEIVIKYAQKDRKLLEEYLTQIGFFNAESVAFIDIGWNATIQKFIQDSFMEREDYPHVYGLYLGFRKGMKHHFNKSKNTIIGILYDDRLNNPTEKIINRFEEVFEEGARAFHPTTMGYKKNLETGVLEPVFKEETAPDRISEVSFYEKINKLQRGVLDFSQEYIRALELTNYSFEDIKPFILTMIERLVAYPNSEEVKNLMNLKHAEDFGNDNIMDFSDEKIDGLKAIFRPQKLIKKLRHSNWTYGTAQSSGIPGITLLLRCYDLFWRHHK
jgi:predicted HAD superfamily hydrolase